MIRQMEIQWKSGERRGAIAVQAVYSARKTMGLEVKPDGQVFARLPRRTSDGAARDFIKNHSRWIVEKWLLMEEKRRKTEMRPRRDYEEDPALERIYRQRAKERLRGRAAYFAPIMGVSYGSLRLSSAKTRWGSCSGKGNLNFHWKLILMPPEVLDYVVVHELAHLKEMNHSPRFWAVVEEVLPDYKERRQWLKENGGRI